MLEQLEQSRVKAPAADVFVGDYTVGEYPYFNNSAIEDPNGAISLDI